MPLFASFLPLYLQDLKPSNLAVNEDCELKVGLILKMRFLLSD